MRLRCCPARFREAFRTGDFDLRNNNWQRCWSMTLMVTDTTDSEADIDLNDDGDG